MKNMSIIKKVILTIAAAALFVVPVTIITLQNNSTKTAEASRYTNYNQNSCNSGDFAKLGSYCPPINSCNTKCQGYYNASNNNTNSCSVMYYSYITNSYSSCTPVQNPNTNYSTNSTNNVASYINTVFTAYTQQPYNNYLTPNYNSCSFRCYDMNNYNTYGSTSYSDYSYYNPNSYGTYIAEPYVDINVPTPNQNYVDIYIPPANNYTSPTPSQNIAYSQPYTYDYNAHNSYEALTTDYVIAQ
jgi:hypothetical protein